MAAILNGLLPSRKKDQYVQERIMNTRWGDASISAPVHGGWSATSSPALPTQESPELDCVGPPTPPQKQQEQDGVYIVEHNNERHHTDVDNESTHRDNITITIPLPWKKKKPAQQTHTRKHSASDVLSQRLTSASRTELMPAPLGTVEAAALPLPESRLSSPIGRTIGTSPVLTFRNRIGTPNLAEVLSPVAEGFAKEGPSSRPVPVLAPSQLCQLTTIECASSAASTGSTSSRRQSTSSHATSTDDQVSESERPASRGIGSTAHMRAGSRGPRGPSRGPPVPFAGSIVMVEATTEPAPQETSDFKNSRRHSASLEPRRRRALSPEREHGSRRPPSWGPAPNRRAASRDSRSRRDMSVEPPSSTTHQTEVPHFTHRSRESISTNDASGESDESEDEATPILIRGTDNQCFTSSRHPYRRRSIASPISSPVASAFGITTTAAVPVDTIARPAHIMPARPTLQTTFDVGATKSQLISPLSATKSPITGPPNSLAPRRPLRNRSQSRTRGLYADMHDDFRLLGRDVHLNTANLKTTVPSANITSPIDMDSPATVFVPTPIAKIPENNVLTSPVAVSLPQVTHEARTASPTLSSASFSSTSTGIAAAVATRADGDRPGTGLGYSSDSSLARLAVPEQDVDGNRALLVALARDHKAQLRREERERARERVVRKLEKGQGGLVRDKDTESGVSDYESTHPSGKEPFAELHDYRRGSADSVAESWYDRQKRKKALVADADDIWG